jgi:hypothetical protein
VFRVLTEATILVHFAFIVFVVAGALLARRRLWWIALHLPALAWAVYAEFSQGVVCPLTALENWFALRAGIASYREDFVAHYLVPVIYQEGLPMRWQYVAGAVVVCFNLWIYADLALRVRRHGSNPLTGSASKEYEG